MNLRPHFKQFLEEYPRIITTVDENFCDNLLMTICEDLKLDYGTFISKCRKQEYNNGRYIAMVALRSKRYSLSQIGRILGNRHHTSILHGLEMFENFYMTEKDYKQTADNIFKKLNIKI